MYRDNRLNPIHEGTTGIQSLDLLGRKVPQNGLAGYQACLSAIESTLKAAEGVADCAPMLIALQTALGHLKSTTEVLLGSMLERDIDLVMANSAKYLEFFGHVVVGWMWLRQGLIAAQALTAECHSDDTAFYRGKLQSMLYFARWELPQTKVWADLLSDLDDTTYTMEAAWF
jgi:butyryl-CoA dehydrogenase